jgi:polyisoprenoid-binding protein YceI
MTRYLFTEGASEVVVHARAPLHTTTARSRAVVGEFEAEFGEDGSPRGAVSGFAEVKLDSFRSGNRLLDVNTLRHLGARRNPVARFTLADAVRAGDSVHVSGDLTFVGETRRIAADVNVEFYDDGSVVITGHWTLSQPDFGLRPPRIAMLKVEDDVAVEFRLDAQPA